MRYKVCAFDFRKKLHYIVAVHYVGAILIAHMPFGIEIHPTSIMFHVRTKQS